MEKRQGGHPQEERNKSTCRVSFKVYSHWGKKYGDESSIWLYMVVFGYVSVRQAGTDVHSVHTQSRN